jgi:hypothetical protein
VIAIEIAGSARLLEANVKINAEQNRTAANFALRGPSRQASDPMAIAPGKESKNGDHRGHDKHPVLAVEAEKRKMLGQKLQRSGSPFPGAR